MTEKENRDKKYALPSLYLRWNVLTRQGYHQ